MLDLLQIPDTNLMSKGKIDSRVFSVCYLLITSIILQTVFSKKITSLMTSNIFPPYFLWIPFWRNRKREKILQAENNVLKTHIITSIILQTVYRQFELLRWTAFIMEKPIGFPIYEKFNSAFAMQLIAPFTRNSYTVGFLWIGCNWIKIYRALLYNKFLSIYHRIWSSF